MEGQKTRWVNEQANLEQKELKKDSKKRNF